MAWRKYQRFVCDNFCKLLQRQTYTFLSSRHGILLCFGALFLCLVSILHFGEVALEWSVVKYQRTKHPYTDNILHQSFQHRLCLPMPVDIVYTWVNGTDPRLLQQLDRLKSELQENLNGSSNFETPSEKATDTANNAQPLPTKGTQLTTTSHPTGCPYADCVPLNSLVMHLHSQARLVDLKTVDPVFQNAIQISNTTMKSSSKANARESLLTIVKFSSESSLKQAVNKAYMIKGEKVVAQRAYLTSQSVELSVRIKSTLLVSMKSNTADVNQFKEFLRTQFGEKLKQLDYHESVKVAVLAFKDEHSYIQTIGFKKGQMKFGNVPLDFQPAILVWEPFTYNENAKAADNLFAANRFADNNEMRYSLRSIEKHAPWIRKIFIVTNGQIPSWLNLDNPRVKIVTHHEIFSNHSHLPTFSSPAIESHLHKIPGLSKKFIYLNDDVMFGKDVWPDDFFTHGKGQKVFLSWPLPNCHEGCPTSWINDKYCDKACNVSECDWDGGDCLRSSGVPQRWQHTISQLKKPKVHDFCSGGCADTWIGDRYCDAACNNPACGMDAGDCGVAHFSQLYSITLQEDTISINLPKGLRAMYFNLSSIFGKGKIVEGEQNGSPIVRSITIAQKFKVMTLTFYPNISLTKISLRLAGHKTMNDTSNVELKFNITLETTVSDSTSLTKTVTQANQKAEAIVNPTSRSVQHIPTTLYPMRIYKSINTTNSWNVPVIEAPLLAPTWKAVNQDEYCVPAIPGDVTVPLDIMLKIQELENDLKAGDITEKGYKRKAGTLLKEKLGLICGSHPTTSASDIKHVKAMTDSPRQTPWNSKPVIEQKLGHVSRKLTSFKEEMFDMEQPGFLPWERQGYFRTIQELQKKQQLKESYMAVQAVPRRRLLDAFSGSLLHVQRVYNRAFGYKARKVPSHMPHMIDVDIMNELQEKFSQEFNLTSSHKLRSPDDMQFALSYFYYIIDQPKEFNMTEIFNEIDMDKSGMLSDRELRTLMAKISTPLTATKIQEIISILQNCSSVHGKQQERPKSEQQYGYRLPAITRALLENCEPITKQLNNSKKRESKHKHEILGEEDVTFKMIKNNASHVLLQLDDIRQKPKKFICLNDNIDHQHEKNASAVKTILVDFYESMFPEPSQFELADDLSNRYLYMDELLAWRKEQQNFELTIAIFLVIAIVVFFVYTFRYPIVYLGKRIVVFCWRSFRPVLRTATPSRTTRLLTV